MVETGFNALPNSKATLGRGADLTGLRFGRWTVLERGPSKNSQILWECKCDCGTKKLVYGSFLKKGESTSCGCYRVEQVVKAKVKHGHAGKTTRTPTYRSWESMRSRVLGDSYKGRKHYRDAGVTICQKWDSYENFLADMGERPKGTTLDRIDPFGNYEPSNCRWADTITQRNNRRDSPTNRLVN